MKHLIVILLFNATLFGQWTIKPANVSNELVSMEFVNQSTGWIAGSQGIILKTTNGGDNWQTFQYNSNYRMYSLKFVNENTGYLIGFYYQDYQFQFNKIIKTVNAGINWTDVFSAMGYNDRYSFNSIDFINTSTGFLCTSRNNGFVGSGSVLRTTNNGDNWSGVNLPGHLVYKKVVCSSNGNVFVWGRYEVDVPGYDTNCIFRSIDGGNNWTEIYRKKGINWRNLSVTGNIVSFAGDFSVSTGILIRSLNSGSSWDTIAAGNIPLITDMIFTSNNTAWLSGYTGNILMTENSGLNWSYQLQSQSFMIYDISMLPNCIGYAAGSNGKILKTTNCGVTGISILNEELPHQFSLSQNYPNPFNPVTKIKFEIPASVETSRRDVLFTIYDALGREIQVLVNQHLQPGTYEANWDASAFPSGIYYYRLETQNYSDTKKMVLIK